MRGMCFVVSRRVRHDPEENGRIHRNPHSTRSFVSWQRGACFPQSTSAQAVFQEILLDITVSQAPFTLILLVPSVDTQASSSTFPLVTMFINTIAHAWSRCPCTQTTRGRHRVRPPAPFASFKIPRRTCHGCHQSAPSHGTDGWPGECRVLCRISAEGKN